MSLRKKLRRRLCQQCVEMHEKEPSVGGEQEPEQPVAAEELEPARRSSSSGV